MINARPNPNGNTVDDFLLAANGLHLALRAVDVALARVQTDVVHGRNYQTQDNQLARHQEDVARLDAARAARANLYDLVREIIDAANA